MVKSSASGSVSIAGKKRIPQKNRRKQDSVQAVALAAISAIAASGDGYFGMAAITVIVIVVALVEYRR